MGAYLPLQDPHNVDVDVDVDVKRTSLCSGHYRLNFHDQQYFTEVYVFRFHTRAFCLFLLAFIRQTLLFQLYATEEKTNTALICKTPQSE